MALYTKYIFFLAKLRHKECFFSAASCADFCTYTLHYPTQKRTLPPISYFTRWCALESSNRSSWPLLASWSLCTLMLCLFLGVSEVLFFSNAPRMEKVLSNLLITTLQRSSLSIACVWGEPTPSCNSPLQLLYVLHSLEFYLFPFWGVCEREKLRTDTAL